MKKTRSLHRGMCTISVDYVGWNPVRVDGFGDEITVHHTDTVFGLTSKPNTGHLPLLTGRTTSVISAVSARGTPGLQVDVGRRTARSIVFPSRNGWTRP